MLLFDDSRWPLVVVRVEGKITLDESRSLERSIDAMLDRHETYAIVWDLAASDIPSRPIVMDMLRWTKRVRLRSREEFELAIERIPCYTAYVLSPRIAKILNFFIQMSPASEVPTGTYPGLDEAIVACEGWLANMGLPAPRMPSTG